VIFVDTNLFVRAIVRSGEPRIAGQEQIAAELFRRADVGEFELTTSESIIAEVAHVLTAKAQYGFTVDEVVTRLIPFVRSRGLTLDRPTVVHDALLIWRDHPKLGFIDALGAAYAKQPRTQLATFDSDLDRIPGIARHDLTLS